MLLPSTHRPDIVNPGVTIQYDDCHGGREELTGKRDAPTMTKTGPTSRVFRRPTRKNARRHATTTSTPWSATEATRRSFTHSLRTKKCVCPGVASLKKDGDTVRDARGKAEVLNSQFLSVFTEEGDSPIPNLGTSSTPDAPNIQVGRNGVMKLLRGLKPHKATGPDEISSRLLKEMA